jgi:predicted permease
MLRERLHDLWLRLKAVLKRRQLDRDLAEELEFHLFMREQALIEQGLSPRDAHHAARRGFGNVTGLKETSRDLWSFPVAESLLQDVRYGLRQLRRTPGFTAVAVLTLALGIGGTTAIFSVVYCGVLDPFTYRDSDRLVTLVERDPRQGDGSWHAGVSAAELLEYREQSHVFDEVFGAMWDDALMTSAGIARDYEVRPVTDNFFRVLGVPPLIGRSLTPDDSKPGAPSVAVLSYQAWQRDFGGDPGIVGRIIALNRRPATVIGVLPPRFTLQYGDVYVPATLSKGQALDTIRRYFALFAHLKPGVTIEQANAEVAVLDKSFAKRYQHPPEATYSVESLARWASGRSRQTWYVLFGAVGLLLLIACVNVANLLVARSTVREKEMAMRAALGASRTRLLRQSLIENLILAGGGAMLGCLLAWNGLGALVAIIPPLYVPTEAVIRINAPVLLFTASTAVLSTMVFGLAPAIQATSVNLQEPLKASGRGAGESIRHGRMRGLLVIGEVALSLILLSGAGLLIRSSFALRHADLGFKPDHLVWASAFLADHERWTPERLGELQIEVLSRVRAVPGVASAALKMPWLAFSGDFQSIEIAGKPSTEHLNARLHGASDAFFETAGIPLLQGRGFSKEEYLHRRKVAVVSRALAEKFFAGETPLGRLIKVPERAWNFDPIPDPWFEVIGVAGDIRDNGPDHPPDPSIYVPYWRVPNFGVLVRTVGEPASLMNTLRREVAAVNNELPVEDVSLLPDVVSRGYYVEPRFVMSMLVAFASLGMALVSVGVYSVLAYAVSRRTQEIGIRMAMGAQAGDVRWSVVKVGLRWLAIGIAIGVPASIALARILENRIWGITSVDPVTLLAVSVVLTAVGLTACYVPARRATKVDPMVALRYE